MRYARSFRELDVYKMAFDSANSIYVLSNEFPKLELYELTSQVRRSSRAVCAMIAEAWYHRKFPKAFSSKLVQALGEAAETQVWLDFARNAGYLAEAEHLKLDDAFTRVGAMLFKIINHPERFAGRSGSTGPDHGNG